MRAFVSILSVIIFVFTFTTSFSCENSLPLLTVTVGTDHYDVDGALYDVVNGIITFDVEGHTRTVAGRFSISTIDGEIELAHGHLILHPSQVDSSIGVVLPEDQRYGLVNLSEELLNAIANSYGYGTDPARDLNAYFREHPEEVIPEL